MKTRLVDPHAPARLRPERWLLAVDPQEWTHRLEPALHSRAGQVPLAAWRLQHGLVGFVTCDRLAHALRQALDDGCPALHLHAAIDAAALDGALESARLAPREARRIELRAWQPGAHELIAALESELARPDAWTEVAWRLTGGRSFPVLAAPGHPGSEIGYREAFRAWRNERLRLGDSGESPFDDEDDPEGDATEGVNTALADTDTNDRAAIAADAESDVDDGTEVDLEDAVRWWSPLPRAPRGAPGLRVMHAAGEAEAGPWFTVEAWRGQTLAPGGGRWSFEARLERLSKSANDRWMFARVVVDWEQKVASRAQRHDHRLCLLPRWQAPVLVTVSAGKTEAYLANPDTARLEDAPQALEGTPLTLVVLA